MKKCLICLLAIFCLSTPALARENAAVVAETLVRSAKSWDGADLPAYPDGRPEITILRIAIPPGVELPLHRHPVLNAGVLLRGELTVVTENKDVLHLKAGDALVEVVNTWHYGKNEGEQTAEIVVFYAGEVNGEPITVKETKAEAK